MDRDRVIEMSAQAQRVAAKALEMYDRTEEAFRRSIKMRARTKCCVERTAELLRRSRPQSAAGVSTTTVALYSRPMILTQQINWQPMLALPAEHKDGRHVLLWTPSAGAIVAEWVWGDWRAGGFEAGEEYRLLRVDSPRYWAEILPPE